MYRSSVNLTCLAYTQYPGFPLGGLPAWLRVITRINPLTYVVNPMRHAVFDELKVPFIFATGYGEHPSTIGKFEPTWVPSTGYGNLGFSVYGDWLVAPITGSLLSPDIAKRRRLDVRLGFSWYPTVAAGTEGWSEEDLARLVTRDSMIGTGLALSPAQLAEEAST